MFWVFAQATTEMTASSRFDTSPKIPTNITPSDAISDRGGSGISSSKISSGATRLPVSRSSPQVLQSDIPTATTPPQLGHRRVLARASAPVSFRFCFGSSWNKARASAGADSLAGLVDDRGSSSSSIGSSNVSRSGPDEVGRSKSP